MRFAFANYLSPGYHSLAILEPPTKEGVAYLQCDGFGKVDKIGMNSIGLFL